MELHANISATAFAASYGRAKAVEVSKDHYSRFWVTPEVVNLWEHYASRVYPHDDLELALRCRFFLERIGSFVRENLDPLFANIAAGFASYPFLLEASCSYIEVDYQNIIELKSRKVEEWQAIGKLPRRNIEFIHCDLSNAESLNCLQTMMNGRIAKRPSFVLLEGITYYWEKEALRRFLESLRNVQMSGSVIAFDFWRPEIIRDPVFLRLEKYLAQEFGFTKQGYNLLDEEFIHSIEGYDVAEITDVVAQERNYCNTSILQDRHNILAENYAIIRRV